MSEPNVVPMTDVMLVLLIIMMVITPMLQKGMSVDLAKTNNPVKMPDANKDDAIIVSVARDGSIYLKSKRIDISQLTSDVQSAVQNRLNKVVFIKSDQRAKYGAVVQAVDDIRAAGVEQLGLITQKSPRTLTGGPNLGG
ncbi:MAG TPA: biopolymer transporter ExbD [Patescibacteria group bacterium]|nr:biopolymer transporter ExbD [Patescibacteria group bacterium]